MHRQCKLSISNAKGIYMAKLDSILWYMIRYISGCQIKRRHENDNRQKTHGIHKCQIIKIWYQNFKLFFLQKNKKQKPVYILIYAHIYKQALYISVSGVNPIMSTWKCLCWRSRKVYLMMKIIKMRIGTLQVNKNRSDVLTVRMEEYMGTTYNFTMKSREHGGVVATLYSMHYAVQVK